MNKEKENCKILYIASSDIEKEENSEKNVLNFLKGKFLLYKSVNSSTKNKHTYIVRTRPIKPSITNLIQPKIKQSEGSLTNLLQIK